MGHNYNDSINFSFKKDLETIQSLPKEKRWKYIWDYYKIIILVLPVALIVLLILGSFCVNMVKGTFFPKGPVSIGIAVSGYSASPDWLQSCEEAIGYDPKREYLQILESPPYSTERDDFVIKSTLWLTAGQPDIFIVDSAGYEYLLSLDILVDLSRDRSTRISRERRYSYPALSTMKMSGCPAVSQRVDFITKSSRSVL